MGGLFSEQGLDAVKRWLDPLFRPLIDVAYQALRRDHLVPEPAAPATTSFTRPQSAASTPSPPGGAREIPVQRNVDMHARLRSRTTRNSPGQTSSFPIPSFPTPSLTPPFYPPPSFPPPSFPTPLQREADRPNSRRKVQGDSLRDGGRGDAGKTPR